MKDIDYLCKQFERDVLFTTTKHRRDMMYLHLGVVWIDTVKEIDILQHE